MLSQKKKSVSSWIVEFAINKKWLFIASVLFAILGVGFGVIPYVVLGRIIINLFSGVSKISAYVKDCAFMTGLWIVRCMCHTISTSFSHYATFNVLGNIRNRCLDKLIRLPLGTVLGKSSGSLKNIICERIDTIETTLAHVTPEFTANICGSIAMFVLIFNINCKLGLISIISVPLGMIFYMGMCQGYEKSFKRTVDSTKALNDTAVEYINGIEVIKAFGKAESSYEKFVLAAKEGAACFVDWQRRCNVWFCLAMAVFPATLLSLLPLGGLMVMHGNLEAWQLILGTILSIGSVQPLITVMSYTDDLAQIGTIIGEVAEILECEELKRPEKSKSLPLTYGISLKDIHFGYREEEILHGINLEIPANKITAFVGPSGSGKSTVAKLIASLWDVNSGSVSIGGINVKNISLEDHNGLIAYVNQDNFLFDKTVRENIRLGNPLATDSDIEEIAKKAGCYDFIMSLENGFETMCGGIGGHLSGGEKQRISIARAMLKDSPIVILDEATSYTDPENEAIIQNALAKLVQGKTVIVIAHRLSTIKDANKIVVFKKGTIDSEGTHEQLLALNGLYKNLWEKHISVKDE